ncbi:MAG: glycosyltransferase [Gammaproteobacteria bacterium]|nr:glycosyltransferase [Gammaproteobacteria bacterium]
MATSNTRTSATRRAVQFALANRLASERERWIERNAFFHSQDEEYLRFLVPEGQRVLELGCETGRMLAALKPAYGVGVDWSAPMIDIARQRHPAQEFICGDIEDPDVISALNGPFDAIILTHSIGLLMDCQALFEKLHPLCTPATRIVVAYYSKLWEPVLFLAERLGLKMPSAQQNWLSTDDIANLLALSEFDVIKREWRQLLPRRFFGLGELVNRYIAPWPVIRRACLRNYVVARPLGLPERANWPATVVVPCRNERGNIAAAVARIPNFCDELEILFIEGHSEDGTLEEIHRVIGANPERNIKVLVQDGKGKGDAVRKGFAHAQGQVLMILDADLTTPPEWLPKFYRALTSGQGEFINGTRLVYPMDVDAMRMLNYFANRIFSWLFTWLLNQRFTDTLCGTKVLTRDHYQQIAANRAYFGEFDPFGDFDLIFGAAKLNLKVVEIPVSYASRAYGETQISRFRHGWLLLKMVVFAFRKMKAF